MSKWTKLAGVALAFGIAQPAMAANCATVSFSPFNSSSQFDPINGNYPGQTITATVTRLDSNADSARLILLDNDAGALKLSQNGPIYNITTGGNQAVYEAHHLVQNNEGALILFASSNTANFTFTIPNTTSDFTGGTAYSEPLTYSISCFKNTTGNGNSQSSNLEVTAFNASVTIAKIVSITTAGPQTINFGNFTTTSQQLQVGVKSTSSINVNVQTANTNQMVLAGAVSPYPANSSIPYTMTLNGTTVSNGTSLTNQTRAGVAGMNWPLILNLTGGLPSGKIAGTYSDTITLTLTPGT
ncbi:hypothetical protein [Sphingobium sp. EP60837]|uniref:hypothetical protein n=1 Tax=Sphingobium sp. EP60837 TaxID=1855519 RepID=UPI0007DD9AD9|nr:hypothetical protein [Sphingobium sp. EP60837]ANI79509.1 hypothetical protein EP837_03115 [Sphingobium sp. EP60837]